MVKNAIIFAGLMEDW